MGEAALAWVSAHRSGFVLGDAALDAGGDVNASWKPLGELAQVCVCVRRHTDPPDRLHEAASDLLAFAWQQTKQGALFLELQRLEPFATYPLEVYAAFASAGLRHAGYESAATTVARTRGWKVTEQQPNRRLGVLNSERRSAIPQHGEMAETLRHTWLGGLPEPWTFERAAGYTLTHVVFHLTDWGRTVDGVPPNVAAYLRHWLPPWLDTCLEGRQWDLSCELLAVAASLPDPPERSVFQEAWTRLAAVQDATGAIPEAGPGRDGVEAEDTFRACYHSTLMAAFAVALAVDRMGETGRDSEEEDGTDGMDGGKAAEPRPVAHAAVRPGQDGQGAPR
ncbi:DUF6895 family protein [Streptomyces scabichelini]|uniref:DUF6895 family protein n=1 Tax=Streptomyces scabichelini TaxID=2711217 RepID=UPI001F498248|nr:hypothetical protein [Streptomyces scabichelini]